MTVQVIWIVEGRATRAERFDHLSALRPDGAVRIVFGPIAEPGTTLGSVSQADRSGYTRKQ